MHIYVSPTDSNKRPRFITYNKKFKTVNPIVANNSASLKHHYVNLMLYINSYAPLRDSLTNTNNDKTLNSYIGHTTNLWHRLTFHLSNASDIRVHIIEDQSKILVDNAKICSIHCKKKT